MVEISISKNTLMWVFIGVLFLAVLFLTFKASSLTGNSVSVETSGRIDTSGWTENEIMNYEMHGVIPARTKSGVSGAATTSSGSSGMVGGC